MRKRVLIGLVAVAGMGLCGVRGLTSYVEMPFGFAISMGELGSGFSAMHKFGFNSDVDATEETIYQGDDAGGQNRFYTNQLSAYTPYISSNNAGDAGLTMTVEGCDENWDPISEDVVLGATAAVDGTVFVQVGTSDWIRVNRFYNTDTDDNTGTIYVHKDSVDGGDDGVPDAPLTDIITVVTSGENQTLQAAFSVCNGSVAYLSRYCASNISTGAAGDLTVRMRAGVVPLSKRVQDLTIIGPADSFCQPFDPPLRFVAQTDIELTAASSSNNNDASGTFDMIMAPK